VFDREGSKKEESGDARRAFAGLGKFRKVSEHCCELEYCFGIE
jgi:hypothetical protein